MKRNESLHPLSQHHHFALVESLEIRRAQQLPPVKRAAQLRKRAAGFLRLWDKAGRTHFREEEEILLPAYARHVPLDQDPDVVRMLADHAFLRALVEEVRATLAANRPLDDALGTLGQRLRDHVRLEEDRIFPRIEQTLSEAELSALGRRFTRLHPKRAAAAARRGSPGSAFAR